MAAAKLDWTETDDKAVDTVRVLAMDAVQKVGNGHPGTAMSLAPAAYLLFQKVMRHNPADPHWPGRDRFVLSCGHSSLTLYLQLFLGGWGLEIEDIKSLRTWGSKTPGHPEFGHTAGVETTTGPLGQGIGNAVGMAMAARRERGLLDPNAAEGDSPFDHQIYALCSDGDIEEGVSSEASSLAGTQQPGQPHADLRREQDLDRGRHQHRAERGRRRRATRPTAGTCRSSTGPTAGGQYREDVPALYDAIRKAEGVTDQPSLIVLRTIIAWPAPNAQNTGKAHGSALGADEVAATKKVLGFDPDQSFEVPDRRPRAHPRPGRARQVRRRPAWQRRVRRAGRSKPSGNHGPLRPAADAHPARGLGRHAADVPRRREGHGHPQGVRRRDQRRRGRGARALGRLCRPRGVQQHHDRGRPVVPAEGPLDRRCGRATRSPGGCSTSGSASTAWARSSTASPRTVAPACSAARSSRSPTTCAASVRLAALMGLPVTYVWTHDSIGLGEDGPTHQPIEHLAALRAIPGLDVVRPADANETAACWQAVLEHTDRPAGLILTRQNVPVFPRGEDGFTRHLQRAARRLRAARRRRRRARRGPDRHRLRGAAGRRGARPARGEGHPGPRRVDAVPRVVRRAGGGLPRDRHPADRQGPGLCRGRHQAGLARGRRRPRPDRLDRALRGVRRLRPHLPGVRRHRRGRRQRGRGQHPHRHRADLTRPPRHPPRPSKEEAHVRQPATAHRGRRLDLARRPLARAHRDRQPRRARQERPRGRGDHQPVDLRRGPLRGRAVRRPGPRARRPGQGRRRGRLRPDHHRRPQRLRRDPRGVRRHQRCRRPGVDRGRPADGARHRRDERLRQGALGRGRPAEPLHQDPGDDRGRPGDHADPRRGDQRQRDADLRPGPLPVASWRPTCRASSRPATTARTSRRSIR